MQIIHHLLVLLLIAGTSAHAQQRSTVAATQGERSASQASLAASQQALVPLRVLLIRIQALDGVDPITDEPRTQKHFDSEFKTGQACESQLAKRRESNKDSTKTYYCHAIQPKSVAEARYLLRRQGAVHDSATRLDWADTDNGLDVNWVEAKEYCSKLGPGWRLPSLKEFLGVIDTSMSTETSCGNRSCYTSSKFKLRSDTFWSGQEVEPPKGAFMFIFSVGSPFAGNAGAKQARAWCLKQP